MMVREREGPNIYVLKRYAKRPGFWNVRQIPNSPCAVQPTARKIGVKRISPRVRPFPCPTSKPGSCCSVSTSGASGHHLEFRPSCSLNHLQGTMDFLVRRCATLNPDRSQSPQSIVDRIARKRFDLSLPDLAAFPLTQTDHL